MTGSPRRVIDTDQQIHIVVVTTATEVRLVVPCVDAKAVDAWVEERVRIRADDTDVEDWIRRWREDAYAFANEWNDVFGEDIEVRVVNAIRSSTAIDDMAEAVDDG